MLAGSSTEYTYGIDALSDTSLQVITIDRVTLTGARDIAIEEAFIAPITNTTLVGIHDSWPWANAFGTLAWEARVPAAGAELRSADGQRNLVLHLVALRAGGGFTGVRVNYAAGGRRFSATSAITLHIKPSC